MTPDNLTLREAAAYARCSRSYLYEQIREGKLRAVRLGRRRLVIRLETLQAWLKEKEAA